jgi:hypothetical protein
MNLGLIMGLWKKVPWHHYLWPEQGIDQAVDILVKTAWPSPCASWGASSTHCFFRPVVKR